MVFLLVSFEKYTEIYSLLTGQKQISNLALSSFNLTVHNVSYCIIIYAALGTY